MTKTQLLEAIFEKLYARAESVLRQFNPCEHKVDKAVHSCIGKADQGNIPQCCCLGCPSWDKGCKAEKPLTCKAWLCGAAKTKHPDASNKLSEIYGHIVFYGFWAFRGDKTKSMANAQKTLNRFTHAQLRKELANLK